MSRNESGTTSSSGVIRVTHPPFDPAYKALSVFATAPPELDVEASRKNHVAATADTILAKFSNLGHREVIAKSSLRQSKT